MKEDIDARLHDLRTALDGARSMPMSASVIVNRTELSNLIDALEKTIDSTLSEATEVVGDREAVLASGMTQAEDIIRAAEHERDQLVSDTDVFRNAQLRAAEIIDAAKREGEELRAETDRYVEDKLANFEHTLERTVDLLRTGRTQPSGGYTHRLGGDSEGADGPQAETDRYVEDKLADFELTLERTIDLIRKGRAKLSGGHVHGLGDDSDVAGITLPDHLER
jgi:cell division septum initiation protein DivIVA